MTARRRDRHPLAVLTLAPLLLALGACGDRDDSPSLGGGGAGDGPGVVTDAGAGTDTGSANGGDTGTDPATPPGTVPTPPVVAGGDGDGGGPLARADVREASEAYAFRRDGPYADVLARCALIEFETFDDACTLETLPFVSQDAPVPTVEDVMARVVVTHDWMGARFEELLRLREAELLPLFGSITSVVIGSTVRPSFYWTGTGGIRLDPEGLWLTVEEKRNVSIEEDFRAQFRTKIAFRNLWTLRKDDRRAVRFFDLEDRGERTLADIEIPVMDLLFHELAHANDFLPPGAAGSLDRTLQPFFALLEIERTWLSPSLDARTPLNSRLLKELAEIRFTDREATPELAAVDAVTAGAEFANDGASHFYNYFTIREDFADLFEALTMKRLYDVDLAVAFTDQPPDPENVGCEDLVVGWGVRNRLGDASVSARARDVTESIYGPDPTLDAFLAEQAGTEIPMTPGVDWCTNLEGGTTMAPRSRLAETADVRRPMGHAERHAWVEMQRRTRGPR